MDLRKLKPSSLVNLYLMSSYLYYILSQSGLLTDDEYDLCCKLLDENWDSIEHQHKHIIDRASLSATTGFTLKESDYPLIVKHAARLGNNSTTN